MLTDWGLIHKQYGVVVNGRKFSSRTSVIPFDSIKSYFYEGRFLKKMLKPEESIELCAFYLRGLIDTYINRGWANSDEWIEGICELDDEHKLGLFIASHYVCGCNLSLRKFALVYMTLIAPFHSLKDIGGNG